MVESVTLAAASPWWWLLSLSLMAVGVAGVILPVLPGAILVLAGVALGAWIGSHDLLHRRQRQVHEPGFAQRLHLGPPRLSGQEAALTGPRPRHAQMNQPRHRVRRRGVDAQRAGHQAVDATGRIAVAEDRVAGRAVLQPRMAQHLGAERRRRGGQPARTRDNALGVGAR